MTEHCIDASVIVKVVVAEDLSDIAAVLVKETEAEELIIIAPFLLEAEVASHKPKALVNSR